MFQTALQGVGVGNGVRYAIVGSGVMVDMSEESLTPSSGGLVTGVRNALAGLVASRVTVGRTVAVCPGSGVSVTSGVGVADWPWT